MFCVIALNTESFRLKVVFQRLSCAFLELLLFPLFSLGRCFFTQFQHEKTLSVFYGGKQAQHFTGSYKKRGKKSVTMHSLNSDIWITPKQAPSWFTQSNRWHTEAKNNNNNKRFPSPTAQKRPWSHIFGLRWRPQRGSLHSNRTVFFPCLSLKK